MKKFVAILFAILMAFSCTTVFAAKSPTIEALYYWTPAFQMEMLNPAPTMADVEFAAETIEYFLGTPYMMVDAMKLNVNKVYTIVHYTAPFFTMDGDFLVILTNEENTYFLTPIVIEESATMDFSNVAIGIYTVYIMHGDNVPGNE